MKKIFFAIYFSAVILSLSPALADVRFLGDSSGAQNQPKAHQPQPAPFDLNRFNNMSDEEIRDFFKKRLDNAIPAYLPEGESMYTPNASSIIPSREYIEQQKENSKSTFQKIYEEALAAIHKKDAEKNSELSGSDNADTADAAEQEAAAQATRFFIVAPKERTAAAEEPQIPTVSVSLPSGRRILAPAVEHIPYFLSYIDIQSNGYLKIEDTITIVANGKKFRRSLFRSFPKYTYYQGKRGHRIEILLDNVSINGTRVPYTLEEIGNDIVMRPKYNQDLEPGVYTYKFTYFINNKLQETGRLVFMDWLVSVNRLNAFITSANAIISLPEGYSFKDRAAIIVRGDEQTTQRTNLFQFAKNVQAFSNNTPLLPGEEMHIITVMDKNIFIKNYHKSLNAFLSDWGNIFYAALGFGVILFSFILSLISLKKERVQNKYRPSYSGSLLRTIFVGRYDRTAFIAQLLELFRKGAVNIEEEGSRFYLSAVNLNSSKLMKSEKKALKQLFARRSTRTEFNRVNNMKFKKARTIFEKSVKKQIKKYRLKQNIGYIIFSVLMLFASEIAIAAMNVNFFQSLTIMLTADLLYAFYIWILQHKFKYLAIAFLFKVFALTAIAVIWIFSSIYTGGITGFLIIAMIALIFAFSRIFNEHNNFINEAKNAVSTFREYLISNSDAINLSKDFINQQSNIFALDIAEYFPPTVANKSSYKLDTAEKLKQVIANIL